MKKTKIARGLLASVGLVGLTAGLALSHYFKEPHNPITGSLNESFDEDWWTEIRERIEANWSGVEDEQWFEEILEYMEDRGYYNSGYRGYNSNYYGDRSY